MDMNTQDYPAEKRKRQKGNEKRIGLLLAVIQTYT
jgi:hypothetical protein